jgi:hypothetical protein
VLDLISERRPHSSLTEERNAQILENVLLSPQNSLGEREKDLDLPKFTVWRSLIEDEFHAYHPTLLESLSQR